MKKYLSTLHQKPHHHKKRFALLASSLVTLSIFGIWSLVKFGAEPIVVKDTIGPVDLAAAIESTGGLDSMLDGLKSAFGSISDRVTDTEK